MVIHVILALGGDGCDGEDAWLCVVMLVTFVVMDVMVMLISVVQIVLVEWFDDGGCATEMVLKRCDVGGDITIINGWCVGSVNGKIFRWW